MNQQRVKDSFTKQGLMQTLSAEMLKMEKGLVELGCPFHPKLSQQHGFFHAGILASLVDSACGYAAYTLMPEDSEVLTVEFKINLLRPAKADKIIAVGKVLKSGRTLTVCEGIVMDGQRKVVFAKMQATLICIKEGESKKN